MDNSSGNWLQRALSAVWSTNGLIGVVVVVALILLAWWLGFPLDEWLQ